MRIEDMRMGLGDDQGTVYAVRHRRDYFELGQEETREEISNEEISYLVIRMYSST